MLALKLAGLFILGALVLWLLFSSAARSSRRIREGRDKNVEE
jgi:hypothetical protein